MSKLRSFLQNYCIVPDNDWIIISELFKKKTIKKNEEIISAGKICKYSYFIEEGLFRNYILNDGNDITNFFIPAPYLLTSRNSFLNQVPASENFQAMENSVVWFITLEQSDKLMELKSWKLFIRKFSCEVNTYIEQQMLESKLITAESRYLKLLNEQPELVNRIPSKHLASYLGVAPQSLSRIRKKIFK